MDELNLKQLTLAVRTIADEKNLPEDVVLSVIEQAIAAAWRRDNGERDLGHRIHAGRAGRAADGRDRSDGPRRQQRTQRGCAVSQFP